MAGDEWLKQSSLWLQRLKFKLIFVITHKQTIRSVDGGSIWIKLRSSNHQRPFANALIGLGDTQPLLVHRSVRSVNALKKVRILRCPNIKHFVVGAIDELSFVDLQSRLHHLHRMTSIQSALALIPIGSLTTSTMPFTLFYQISSASDTQLNFVQYFSFMSSRGSMNGWEVCLPCCRFY